MKRFVSSVILVLLVTSVNAQKVINDPNVEPRTVGSFEGISVSGGIDLFLSNGPEALAVSASKPEYRDQIKTEVVNGILRIYYDHRKGLSFTNDRRLRAYVSYKNLKSLTATAGSDVEVDGTLKAANLKLSLSAGSDFKGQVDVTDLTIHQSSGSDVTIKGTATNLTVQASSGSDFNGYNLVTDVCSVQASSGSDVELTVTKVLSAKASGASDIKYKGKPVLKEVKVTGASSFNQRT